MVSKNISGVYAIHNIENDAVYIGSSINVRRRIVRHKSELKHNNHNNIYLQRAYNRYGGDKFEFTLLFGFNKIVSKEELAKCEMYFCNLVDAFNNKNYNLSKNTIHPDRDLCSKGGKIGGRIAKEKGQIQALYKYAPLKELGKRQGLKNKLSGQVSNLGKIQGVLNKTNGVLQKAWKKSQESCTKEWYVKYGDGEEFRIKNLNKFCRDKRLRASAMWEVASNKTIKHKGWKIRRLNGAYTKSRLGREYIITKDGRSFKIKNLTKFLDKNKIPKTPAYRNLRGEINSVHGFKIRKCKIEGIEK